MATSGVETSVRALDAGLRGGSLPYRYYKINQVFSDRRRTTLVSGLWGDQSIAGARTHADILKPGRKQENLWIRGTLHPSRRVPMAGEGEEKRKPLSYSAQMSGVYTEALMWGR